jgi:hypothetical protein
VRSPETVPVPQPVAFSSPSPASQREPAVVPKPPAPQALVALKTPDAVTLDQIAALLGPASRRAVTFALSSADAYKKADLTHRVRLTWTGPLQALVDQLAEIYGLDVAVDDSAIRFSSRQGERAGAPSTTRAP